MKTMWKLFASSVKMLYRDKQALFWALAFPVIFVVVFGLFDFNRSPTVKIDAVGEQSSPVYRAVVAGLKKVDTFHVYRKSSLSAARGDLADGKVDVVLEVPSAPAPASPTELGGLAPPTELQVFYNGSNFSTNQFALTTINQIVDGMNLRMSGVSQPPIEVVSKAVQAKTVNYYDFLLPGLVAMGVMNFSIVGMGVAIARFREQRILKRILATPLAPVKFLSSQVAARLVLSIAQAALILSVGVFVFDGHVYGNVLSLFVLATIANLVFLNLGFAVAGRASNPDAAQGIGQAVALPMMFFSGVFFPTDTLPKIVQTMVKFLPLTPLLEAMRKVAVDGRSITATGHQILILGIWVVASFALAGATFRFAETK